MEKEIKDGALPQSDSRSCKAMEKRYATEWGEFQLWCARANRAVQFSGVSAAEVEEHVKEHYQPTTWRFLKYNMSMRVMAQPPYQISGARTDGCSLSM